MFRPPVRRTESPSLPPVMGFDAVSADLGQRQAGDVPRPICDIDERVGGAGSPMTEREVVRSTHEELGHVVFACRNGQIRVTTRQRLSPSSAVARQRVSAIPATPLHHVSAVGHRSVPPGRPRNLAGDPASFPSSGPSTSARNRRHARPACVERIITSNTEELDLCVSDAPAAPWDEPQRLLHRRAPARRSARTIRRAWPPPLWSVPRRASLRLSTIHGSWTNSLRATRPVTAPWQPLITSDAAGR